MTENEKKEIQAKAKIGRKELFGFLIYHNYYRITGILMIIFSIGCLIAAAVTFGKVKISATILLVVMGCLFTVLQPISLYFKAGHQIKNPFFDTPISYVFSEEGVKMEQKEESAFAKWEEVWKVVNHSSVMYVYFTPVRANILPLLDDSGKLEEIMKLAKNHMDSSKVKG